MPPMIIESANSPQWCDRTEEQYSNAYNGNSIPVKLPIPSSIPEYKADKPIHLDKKAEGVKLNPAEKVEGKPHHQSCHD